VSNLKSVALTVLELLAFNGQKFRGSHDPGYARFWENRGVMYRLSLETRTSNLKSVALTVLELLAFNAQKFRGSFQGLLKNIFFGIFVRILSQRISHWPNEW